MIKFILCLIKKNTHSNTYWIFRKSDMSIQMIDYYKYLKCQECKDSGLYCKSHRIEVDAILNSA
jgi:hypothetical protein